jgi:hypothetical protein
LALALTAAVLQTACNPTFNWREVRLSETALSGLLPCKPDTGSRQVALAGQPLALHMAGCEAGGALFALSAAQLGDASATAVLAQWRASTLANMQAGDVLELPLTAAKAAKLPALTLVRANGKRPDGSAVTLHGLWFAQGREVFHAVVYADAGAAPDGFEPFFAGLQLSGPAPQ